MVRSDAPALAAFDQVATPVVAVADFDSPTLCFNLAARTFFGVGADDDRFYVKEYYKQLNRDDLERGLQALSEGATAEVELLLRGGEGRWHPARLVARPQPPGRPGAVGAVVTLVVGASAPVPSARGEAHARLRDLLWDAPVIALSISEDFPSRPPVWNDALYALLGYGQRELTPSLATFLEHVHPADRQQVTSLHERLAAGELDAWQGDYRIVSHSGETTWVNARALAETDEDGHLAIASVIAPVNDHRSAAYEAKAARADLERLVNAISHDLRAPARQTKMFVELLLEARGEILTDDERVVGDYALNCADRLVRMIEGIVHLSRIGSELGEPRELALEPMIRSVIGEQYRDEAHRFRIEDVPNVFGYPPLLRRLFANLFDNAVKFTRDRPGTYIDVTGHVSESGLATIAVTDQGVGFTPELAPKLFQVFHRLHGAEEYEGLGLGLAESRRIAEVHGGKLAIESATEGGVTVTLQLPLPPLA